MSDPGVAVTIAPPMPSTVAVAPTAGKERLHALIASLRWVALVVEALGVLATKVPAVVVVQPSEPLATDVRTNAFDPTVIVTEPDEAVLGLPPKVPVTVLGVGFGVNVNIFPPFVMVAKPLLRTLPVKVPEPVAAPSVRVNVFPATVKDAVLTAEAVMALEKVPGI